MNAKQLKALEEQELRDIIRDTAGRRYLARLMIRLGVTSRTFDQDTRKHSFNEGRRDAGLVILDDLAELDAQLPYRLIQEYISDERKPDRHTDN
jgi:hypothetical protein